MKYYNQLVLRDYETISKSWSNFKNEIMAAYEMFEEVEYNLDWESFDRMFDEIAAYSKIQAENLLVAFKHSGIEVAKEFHKEGIIYMSVNRLDYSSVETEEYKLPFLIWRNYNSERAEKEKRLKG